jgi:hypothetical protein
MPWLKLLNVVFHDCDAEIEQARKDFPRLDDALEGLKWMLARNGRPVEAFPTSASGTDFMLGVAGDRDGGIPDMWVVYKYDDEKLTILAINAMEADEDKEE